MTEGKNNSIICTIPYKAGEKDALLKVTAKLIGKSLVFDLTCDKGVIKSIDVTGWSNAVRQKQVTTPYYSGKINYLSNENLFVNTFLDWTSSHAATHDMNKAVYLPLTDGAYNNLKETIIYTSAWHLAEVFPNIPNPKSPYLKQVGERVVLDIWGGRFDDITKKLDMLNNYGINNCAVIIHDWQRSGYDNALPSHYPANPAYGGDEGMKSLVSLAKKFGHLISIHENYVDYYPNYDFYDENDIALDSKGEKQLAWYNESTKIQSYAIKPTAILRLAATQSPEIKRRYGTNANYLDVHSSATPFFHVDQRAGEEGAGMFNQTYITHQKLFDYERKLFNGPVLGEGCWHWYWSGFLDGAEAQFGAGWPSGDGMTAPLMVDFDLLRIHPMQSNHGMGYYERWWKNNSWSNNPPMAALDQYRMQEIAYGHTGFLSKDTWDNINFAWLEHNLMTPISSRYAEAKPVSIRYLVDNKWIDTTAAAKIGDWNRVNIKYDNGLQVTANNLPEPLGIHGYTLPQFGWLVEGNDILAYNALIDNSIVDFAETENSIFANARDAEVWNSQGIKRILPELVDFQQTGSRSISFTYKWHVGDTLEGNYISFVHFGDLKAEKRKQDIKFQQDHELPTPTNSWRKGSVISDGKHTLTLENNVADGDYNWYIGLYDPKKGDKVSIQGNDDGYRRILLGILHVRDNGNKITFTHADSEWKELEKLYNKNLNTPAKVVNFGNVQTNGSISIKRDGNYWVMQAMPFDKDIVVKLNTKRFPIPESVECQYNEIRNNIPVYSDDGWWGFNLNGSKSYRWKVK